MSTKNRTAEQQPGQQFRFPNQMIEQINIALEQKGSGISAALKPAVGGLTSEKRRVLSTSIKKSDEE